MGSMMYFVGQIVLLGTLPIFAFTYLLPTPLAVAFPGNSMVQGFVSWIGVGLNQVLLGTVVIAAGTIIPIVGFRIWKTWNWIMFFLGMAGAVTFLAVVGSSNQAAFVQGFNNYAAQFGTSYQGIFQLAKSNGWTLAPSR